MNCNYVVLKNKLPIKDAFDADGKPIHGTGNIINYAISELDHNEDGTVKIHPMTGQPVETGTVFKHTLLGGQEMAFPEYVAEYLIKIYGGTLKRGKTISWEEVNQMKAEEANKKAEDENYKSQFPTPKSDTLDQGRGGYTHA